MVSDALIDIVAAGYDAGVQLGEAIDRHMIALPVTGNIRMAVVGAPAYFARRPKPRHPRDLREHVCLNWHRSADVPPYRWEFTQPAVEGSASGARDITVEVLSRMLSTDSAVNIRLARAGLGLTITYEDEVRDGSPALRAFVAYLREVRRQ